MSEPLFDGYDGMTYPGRKRCVRCLRFNDNRDYPLCDDCREGDLMAEKLCDDEGLIEAARIVREEMDKLWLDEVYTREVNRP